LTSPVAKNRLAVTGSKVIMLENKKTIIQTGKASGRLKIGLWQNLTSIGMKRYCSGRW
jgi:hypothetical protein